MKHYYSVFFGFYPADYQLWGWALLTDSYLGNLGKEFALELPRQVGKTELVARWLAFVLVWSTFLKIFDFKPFRVIVFAPTKKQAGIDFGRVRALLPYILKQKKVQILVENSETIMLSNGSKISILPLTASASIEGDTGDFLLFEEAQGLDDEAVENKAMPMATATGAPSFFVGTAGVNKCKFYELLNDDTKSIVLDANDIILHKRKAFEKTKNKFHLNYETMIRNYEQSMLPSAFDRQFFNKWALEESVFITEFDFSSIVREKPRFNYSEALQIWGVDQALKGDFFVLSRSYYNPDLGWVDNYENVLVPTSGQLGNQRASQYQFLTHFFNRPENHIDFIVFDTTGNQSDVPEWFISQGFCSVANAYYYDYTGKNKQFLFQNYEEKIKNGTCVLINPDKETKKQHLILEKTYSKNGLMNVQAPQKVGFHDDIPCGIAMTVFGSSLTKIKSFEYNNFK